MPTVRPAQPGSAMPARQIPVHPAVQVWLLDLDHPETSSHAHALSPDEIARSRRFVSERDRLRFIAGRASLRRMVAAESGIAPEALAFVYGPHGKPDLPARGAARVWFNLAHSEQFALLAITRVGPVGVDIEKARPLDVLQLAEMAFSDAERAELIAMDEAGRQAAFFAGWTRKEAYLKARGDGIGHLGEFDVSLAPEASAPLTRVDGQPHEQTRWTLTSFTPVDGYAAALCLGEHPGTKT